MPLTGRSLMLLAASGSAALLAGAFVFQALGYAPCTMCLWQRWPHAAAIAVGAGAVLMPRAWVALTGALCALTTAAIGLYHTGVERMWWEGPSTCTSSSISGLSTDDLFNQIMSAPLVRCDEVAWSLMGLSMASWNMLASLALMSLWVIAARKPA